MIIINETIRVELIVFLALFADLATIAVAYDNAHFEQRPVEWQLPKIWIISVVLGVLLALGTWVIRGAMFLPNGGIIENFGSIQGILFLEVSLTENWLIFVTRGGNTWPSWQLVGAILGVDVISTLFCVFGWLTGHAGEPSDPATKNVNLSRDGHTSIVTVLIVWGFSIGVTIVIAIVYYLLSSLSWLDNLGRAKRSHADTQMENVLMHLSKVAVAHEKDEHGNDRWHLTPKATEAEEDD
jgi:H+-transporting ATPase